MSVNSIFVNTVSPSNGYGFNANVSCPGTVDQKGYVNVNGECVLFENEANAPAFLMAPGESVEPVLIDNQRYGTFTPVNPF